MNKGNARSEEEGKIQKKVAKGAIRGSEKSKNTKHKVKDYAEKWQITAHGKIIRTKL